MTKKKWNRKVRCNCSDLRTCTLSQCFNLSFLNTQHDKNSIIPQKSDQQLAFIPRGREREGTFLNLKLSWTRCPAAAWLRTILKLRNCIHIGGVYILLYFWVSKTAYKSSNKKYTRQSRYCTKYNRSSISLLVFLLNWLPLFLFSYQLKVSSSGNHYYTV